MTKTNKKPVVAKSATTKKTTVKKATTKKALAEKVKACKGCAKKGAVKKVDKPKEKPMEYGVFFVPKKFVNKVKAYLKSLGTENLLEM